MELLDRLLEHDRWATRRLLELSRGLTEAQLDQEFDIGHRTLRVTFEHMIFNVEFWAGLLAGQRAEVQRGERSLAGLSARHAQAYADFARVARRVRDEGRLDEVFGEPFPEPLTYGGGILEIVLHDAEHRGEALHMLARLGVANLPELDHGRWDITRLGG